MSKDAKEDVAVTTEAVARRSDELDALHAKDNKLLAELGYKSEFKREFSVSLAFTFKDLRGL